MLPKLGNGLLSDVFLVRLLLLHGMNALTVLPNHRGVDDHVVA